VRRASLLCGGLFLALGLLSLVEALRIKDAWQGARLMPAALGVTLIALGTGHLLPVPDRDPSFCGSAGIMVACTVGGVALVDNPNTPLNEANIVTSDCVSSAGTDGLYGTADDGTIYYAEATENGLRAFVRENRAFAFSFINGIGINHPELCGTTNECGDSPATGTRQVMFQNIQDLGATLSCFNCSALGQHTVPTHGFDRYNFKWTPLPGVHIPEDHPNTNGNIPEAGGEPSNGF
jgi:hypothetical protein